jgi:hypothetical protein
MDDLRNHLFATLEALQDLEKPMEVDRAKAINHTAQTLINSAKVEVDFIEATGLQPAGRFFAMSTDVNTPNGRTPQTLTAIPSRNQKSLPAAQR